MSIITATHKTNNYTYVQIKIIDTFGRHDDQVYCPTNGRLLNTLDTGRLLGEKAL